MLDRALAPDQIGQDLLSFEVCDQALERASGVEGEALPTLLFASYYFTCKSEETAGQHEDARSYRV
jgi:hypothetical protein